MKTLLFILSFLVLQHAAKAQKMPSDWFEEADEFCESKEFDKALNAYQYIVDHYPRNELYPKSFYNIGYINFYQKRFIQAIPVFKAILTSNFNEKESLGGNIMDDPFSNYRHRACEILSGIYYERNVYDSALYYFALADTAYPYLNFCGNGLAENKIHTALKYGDIYKKLNQPQKAIAKLLPVVFIELANNSKVIKELQTLLKNQKGLKSQFDNSLQGLYAKTFKSGATTYKSYYIIFLDTKILVRDFFDISKEPFDTKKAVKSIRDSRFYKMIEQL